MPIWLHLSNESVLTNKPRETLKLSLIYFLIIKSCKRRTVIACSLNAKWSGLLFQYVQTQILIWPSISNISKIINFAWAFKLMTNNNRKKKTRKKIVGTKLRSLQCFHVTSFCDYCSKRHATVTNQLTTYI